MAQGCERSESWLKTLILLAAMLLVVWLIAGCSVFTPKEKQSLLEQQQRESVAGKTTTDVVTASKVQPPEVTITSHGKDGSVVEVKQPAQTDEHTTVRTTASETSDSTASGGLMQSETIPLYVKLIGFAIGLLLVYWVISYIVNKSRALTAAWKVADEHMAAAVHNVRSQATTAVDPAQVQAYKAAEAIIENQRAELNKD